MNDFVMRNKRRVFRSIVLPVMILVPLVWIMTGCIYFPFFEHRLDNGPNVRELVGEAGSDRPIRPGKVTRDQVVSLLGEAPYISADERALGYVARTGFSSWVYPLCFFAAEPADQRVYVVRLVFAKDGTLERYDWEHESGYVPPTLLFGQSSSEPETSAVERLNKRSAPTLESRMDHNHPDSRQNP